MGDELAIRADDLIAEDQIVAAGPWMRLLARLFDLALVKIILINVLLPKNIFHLAFDQLLLNEALWSVLVVAVWTFLEPYVIIKWGNTPGKHLLQMRLAKINERSPGFEELKRRSHYLWFRGLAYGIPVVNLLFMFAAYNDLVRDRATAWDKQGQWKVTRRKMRDSERLIAIVIMIPVLFWALGH